MLAKGAQLLKNARSLWSGCKSW